ncbi:hypothetical protein QLQ15_09350 [Lysobacter sp. LF1]|uniref:Uncharacterized protein n=1 Tax=Lysobacter stagni TaxID=3045172 RepID=A0ABT6XG47_9GAMM|nr:hypothetical protein [Lysobacter sp. LF1]MDI9239114.1 hypothetical protein [Lysobacter sp. LF1]
MSAFDPKRSFKSGTTFMNRMTCSSPLRQTSDRKQVHAKWLTWLTCAALLAHLPAQCAEASDENLVLDVRFSCAESGFPQLRISLRNQGNQDLIMHVDQLPQSTSSGVMELGFNRVNEDSRPLFETLKGTVERGFVVLPAGGVVAGSVPLDNEDFQQSVAAEPTFVAWNYTPTGINPHAVSGRTGGIYLSSHLLSRCQDQTGRQASAPGR